MTQERDFRSVRALTLEPSAPTDELLVNDARAGLTPSQMVERKLFSLLQSESIRVARPESNTPARRFA